MKALVKQTVLPVAAMVCMGMASCNGRSAQPKDADTSQVAFDYHADNDIVMTVRSLIDAVRVGQPLDSAEYDYEGVLTDGSGRPLYTDLQGAPGIWEVDVVSPSSAQIRNVYLGDLLTGDLEQYVVAGLSVGDSNRVETDEDIDDFEYELSEYDFGEGVLRFETRIGRTTNGLEGPLLTIRVQKK